MLKLVATAQDLQRYREVKQRDSKSLKKMRFRRIEVDERTKQTTFHCGEGIGSLIYDGSQTVNLSDSNDSRVFPLFRISSKPDPKLDLTDKFLAWLRNTSDLMITTWTRRFAQNAGVNNSPLPNSNHSWQKAKFEIIANSIPGRTAVSAIFNNGLLVHNQPAPSADPNLTEMNISYKSNRERVRQYTLSIRYQPKDKDFDVNLRSFVEDQSIQLKLSKKEAAKISRPFNGTSSSLIHKKIYEFVQGKLS